MDVGWVRLESSLTFGRVCWVANRIPAPDRHPKMYIMRESSSVVTANMFPFYQQEPFLLINTY